jgi:ATP-dependent RNA helicase DeaD
MKFEDFGLDPAILQALSGMGFKEPTPIQAETLPLVLEGQDVIGLAETGSGKTAACAIPVCQRIDVTQKFIQALIIVPTRELALQYAVEAQRLGAAKGVKAFALFGGEDVDVQHAKLKTGVHVLVATPGRLIDLVYARQIDLSHVSTLILDEADEMLSMGFYDDVEFIIGCLIHAHQTLLFSATMPIPVRELAKKHMRNPTEVVLTKGKGGPAKIEHLFVYCRHPAERGRMLVELLEDTRPRQAIIFAGARHQVEQVSKALRSRLNQVDFLHGGLSQEIRRIITNKFRTGKIRYLVATDVASRGLDFSGVTHVFNVQLPEDEDVYVHRSGRTGRLGREGVAISLVTPREMRLLERVLKKIHREARWIGNPPPPKEAQKRREGSNRATSIARRTPPTRNRRGPASSSEAGA